MRQYRVVNDGYGGYDAQVKDGWVWCTINTVYCSTPEKARKIIKKYDKAARKMEKENEPINYEI